MVMIPSNWNEIDENRYMNLTPSGHILRLVHLSEYINKNNGNKSLKIEFDIDDDNEFKGCFNKIFNNSGFNAKWPNEGTKYLSLKPEHYPYLKTFITSVQKSNDKEIIVEPNKELDLEQFYDLVVGGEFGYEEYEKDGEIKLGITLFRFKSLDQLPYLKEPQVKTLDGRYVDYDIYKTGIDNEQYKDIPTISSEKQEDLQYEDIPESELPVVSSNGEIL